MAAVMSKEMMPEDTLSEEMMSEEELSEGSKSVKGKAVGSKNTESKNAENNSADGKTTEDRAGETGKREKKTGKRKPRPQQDDEADWEDDDGADWEDDELELEEDKSSGSALNALTYGVIIVLAVLLCTLVWVATHRNRGGDVKAETDSTEDAALFETLQEESAVGTTPADIASAESGAQASGQTEAGGSSEAGSPAESSPPGAGSGAGIPADGTEAAANPVSGDSSMTFREVEETVTAKDVTNLRSVPSTEDSENVLSQLLNGETLTRTGINENTGWSRLDWNGQTVYAVTQYLTSDLNYKPPVSQGDPNRVTTMDGRVIIFVDCDDTITPKEYVNLRVEPSTSQGESTVRTQLQNGEQAHRTGYSPDSGWSRVEYNGEVLYVVTSYVINP